MTLDPDLAALRDQAPPPAADLAEMRERVRAGNRLCAAVGPGDVSTTDREIANIPCRIYEGSRPVAGTIVYVHGGGWVTGDLDYADEFCRTLASVGNIRVMSVDYRLAPENPYPAALSDVADVLDAVRSHYKGIVALAGDSAGGNLVAVVGVEKSVDTLILIYPALDAGMVGQSYDSPECGFPIGRREMTWFYEQYASGVNRSDARLSPLRRAIGAEHPRTFVVTAEHDPLRDEGTALVGALTAAGISVEHRHFPAMCHGFLRFTGASPAAASARDELATAVAEFVLVAPAQVDVV